MFRITFLILAVNILSFIGLSSQERSDRLIAELESYKPFKITGWEYGLKDASDKTINDNSKWKSFSGNFSTDDSCKWFRVKFKMPDKIAGSLVKDERIIIKISADGLADLFLDGTPLASFNNPKGEKRIVLFDKAKPGSDHLLVIKLKQSTIISRFFGATLEQERLTNVLQKIDDLKFSIEIAKMMCSDVKEQLKRKKFSINMSKTDPDELKKLKVNIEDACNEIDIASLTKGNYKPFLSSVDKAYKLMQPVSEFAKRYTVFISGNAHIDAAWLWRWNESLEVARYTFLQQLKLMEEYPEFVFSQSSSIYYKWMEKFYPDIFKAIKEKVKSGSWDLVGGTLLEPDCNLISGESWARQLLYGQSYFINTFGSGLQLGWNPDSFGYNWNMPQFYSKAGIKAFITQKISWNDTNEFPYHLFWWQGVDGSKILTYFPMSGYVNSLDYKGIISDLKLSEANTGRNDVLILYGFGNHGGGPERFMLDRVLKFRENPFFPNVKFIKPYEYLEQMDKNFLETIPTWNDELYLEYHRGTFTTQAAAKSGNRRSEFGLANSEKLALFASLYGKEYPKDDFNKAWEKTLFNQFHDILPGSSIAPVYKDAKEDYDYIDKTYKKITDQSLTYLGDLINTSAIKGDPFIIFNSASWERTDICKLTLPEKFKDKNIAVTDDKGKVIPFQKSDENVICFLAKNIPGLGYKTYSIIESNTSKAGDNKSNNNYIENKYFQVKVNDKTGNISSLYDKINKKEVLSSEGNLIQLFDDRPTMYDAWEIKYTGVKWDLNRADKVIIEERGDVFSKIKITKSFLGSNKDQMTPTSAYPSSFFTQNIILYNDLNRIDVEMESDWWEEHVLAKIAFPVNVKCDEATFEIPNGAIKRPTTRNNDWEKARYEVPALTWVDLSDDNYGVSLLNIDKYGHDIEGNNIRLTLLRSPTYPDPGADRGKHKTIYSLYPHKGSWQDAGTPKRAFELNNPLIARFTDLHNGTLPGSQAFITLDNDNMIISAVKKAEKDSSIIIRIYESTGKEQDGNIIIPFGLKKAYETDLLENNIQSVISAGNSIPVQLKPFETKTIRVEY